MPQLIALVGRAGLGCGHGQQAQVIKMPACSDGPPVEPLSPDSIDSCYSPRMGRSTCPIPPRRLNCFATSVLKRRPYIARYWKLSRRPSASSGCTCGPTSWTINERHGGNRKQGGSTAAAYMALAAAAARSGRTVPLRQRRILV